MVLRLGLGMAPLAKIGPPVAGKTAAPVQPHRQSMPTEPPEFRMIPRRLLLMAVRAVRLRVAEAAVPVGLESGAPYPAPVIPLPGEVVPLRLGLLRPPVVMAILALHPLREDGMLEGGRLLAPLIPQKHKSG